MAHVLVSAADISRRGLSNEQISLRDDQLRRLAHELIARKGADPTAWRSPAFSMKGYEHFYKTVLVRNPARRVSSDELRRRFVKGERLNPKSGKWESIYWAWGMRNTNPFVSEERFLRQYRESRVKAPTTEELSKARAKYRKGMRYNRQRGWHRPAHINHPHDPALAREEVLEMWSRGTSPNGRMSRAAAAKKIDGGWTWDWTVGGKNKWRRRRTVDDPALTKTKYLEVYQALHPRAGVKHMARVAKSWDKGVVWDWHMPEHDKRRGWRRRGQPSSVAPPKLRSLDAEWNHKALRRRRARMLRTRKARSKVAGGALANALGAVTSGGLEAQRVSKLRLHVWVRRKRQSRHTFVIVFSGMADNRGRVSTWNNTLTPRQQKWLLQRWYIGSGGFLSDSGVPSWLVNARTDNELYNWFGR